MVKIVEKVLIVLVIVLTIFSTIILIDLESVNFNHYGNNQQNELPINISQDVSGPNITFVKPSINNSIIKKSVYEIIVNITDEHPPSPGNVTIQISNSTEILFSAPMNYSSDNLWSFEWNNISDYKSYIIFIIRVWAIDSLSNENWSEEWYVIVYLSRGTGPNIILIILYLIIVSLIFALIIFLFNRKLFYKITREQEQN